MAGNDTGNVNAEREIRQAIFHKNSPPPTWHRYHSSSSSFVAKLHPLQSRMASSSSQQPDDIQPAPGDTTMEDFPPTSFEDLQRLKKIAIFHYQLATAEEFLAHLTKYKANRFHHIGPGFAMRTAAASMCLAFGFGFIAKEEKDEEGLNKLLSLANSRFDAGMTVYPGVFNAEDRAYQALLNFAREYAHLFDQERYKALVDDLQRKLPVASEFPNDPSSFSSAFNYIGGEHALPSAPSMAVIENFKSDASVESFKQQLRTLISPETADTSRLICTTLCLLRLCSSKFDETRINSLLFDVYKLEDEKSSYLVTFLNQLSARFFRELAIAKSNPGGSDLIAPTMHAATTTICLAFCMLRCADSEQAGEIVHLAILPFDAGLGRPSGSPSAEDLAYQAIHQAAFPNLNHLRPNDQSILEAYLQERAPDQLWRTDEEKRPAFSFHEIGWPTLVWDGENGAAVDNFMCNGSAKNFQVLLGDLVPEGCTDVHNLLTTIAPLLKHFVETGRLRRCDIIALFPDEDQHGDDEDEDDEEDEDEEDDEEDEEDEDEDYMDEEEEL